MDPATIVGTTSAILSFVQFSGNLISTACEIYESVDGAVDDNKKLEEVVIDFQTRLRSLRPTEESCTSSDVQGGADSTKTDAEKSLLRTAGQCETLGHEILEILNKTKAKVVQIDETQSPSLLRRSWRRLRKDVPDHTARTSKPTFAEAIKASIQTVWNKEKISRDKLDTEGKHDTICRAFQKSSEQVGKIGNLLESLMQHKIPQLQCLQSFLEDFEQADAPSRLEQRNIDRILRALEFEGMNARRNQVERTTGNTFQWLIANDSVPEALPELKISLKKWLSDGAYVYHVTGKPGSGKSTLMKLIDQAAESRKQLETWASRTGDRLIVASFYTWKAANAHRLQNQEEGLIRTLLHQILTAAPELTQVAFAKHPCWNPQEHRLVNHLSRSQGISATIRLESEQILAALECLFHVQGYCFFLLIDGMDEFEKAHNHRAIAERVLQWCSLNSDKVKACVSSREENAFMGKFSADQRLRLHVVTDSDIRQLVVARLTKHNHFRNASWSDRQDLVCKLVNKAEGVFLWVVLTIHELEILMDDCQSFRTLLKEVDRLPEEMEDFLREILSRIPEAYKEESEAVLSVATTEFAKERLLTLFHYSMLRKCIEMDDPDAVHNPSTMSLDEVVSQMNEFRSRLPSLCKGLLETAHGANDRLLYRRMSDKDRGATIQFSHRSVFDFLRNRFTNAPVAVDSEVSSEARAMLLAVRSVIEVTRAIPWDKNNSFPTLKDCSYLAYMLKCSRVEMLLNNQLGNLVFPLFRTIEATILHSQKAIAAAVPFNSTTSVGVRLESRPLTLFSVALQQDFCEYIQWATKNYPPWFLTQEAKSYIVASQRNAGSGFLLTHTARICTLPIRCLTEGEWLSINEPISTGRYASTGAFQLRQASMWIIALLWYLLDTHDNTPFNVYRWNLHKELEAALSAGAEPRIRFNWWSQAESAAPHRGSNREADLLLTKSSLWEPKETPNTRKLPLGSEFGVTIQVGDSQEPQLLQGARTHEPRKPGEEDPKLIRFFVSRFRKSSGTATLRDVVEELFKPEMKICRHTGDIMRNCYEEDLRKQRRYLKAVDDALARVGALDNRSDFCAPGGTNENGQNPDRGEGNDQPCQPYWLTLRNYFHDWQTFTIPTLAILLAVLYALLVPQQWWQ